MHPTMRAVVLLTGLLPAPLAQARECGVYSAVTYASDYRYEGVSSTDLKPALQGYVHWQGSGGDYLGLFASQVNYGYPGSPTIEVDLYGGKAWRMDKGRSELKLEGLYTTYPDNRTPGPTFDFFQVKAAAHRTSGSLSYGAAAMFVPDASYTAGRAWRAEVDAVYSLSPSLAVHGLVGGFTVQRAQDRVYWELGAAKTWKNISFQLRYSDTDLSRRECGFNPRICGAALVGAVTVSLRPIT